MVDMIYIFKTLAYRYTQENLNKYSNPNKWGNWRRLWLTLFPLQDLQKELAGFAGGAITHFTTPLLEQLPLLQEQPRPLQELLLLPQEPLPLPRALPLPPSPPPLLLVWPANVHGQIWQAEM